VVGIFLSLFEFVCVLEGWDEGSIEINRRLGVCVTG
jgi:hypothetical protein